VRYTTGASVTPGGCYDPALTVRGISGGRRVGTARALYPGMTDTTNDTPATSDIDRTLSALIEGHDVADRRVATLRKAIEAGASPEVLVTLRDVARVASGSETIVLPAHRYEGLSRGRGWARMGRGTGVTWGERVDGGYRVGRGAVVRRGDRRVQPEGLHDMGRTPCPGGGAYLDDRDVNPYTAPPTSYDRRSRVTVHDCHHIL
jgi:hypothetical protein